MNSWKLNSISGHLFRNALCNSLKIEPADIYKVVGEIKNNMVILKNGDKYQIEFKQVELDES